MSYLYTFNYWVPFPRSEYGGLFVVIAASKQDCLAVIRERYNGNIPYGEEECMNAIAEADIIQLNALHTSRVVAEFTT
jgi:hypothetical protein